MKRAWSSWIAVPLAVLAGTSVADVGTGRSPPVGPEPTSVSSMPIECRQFLQIPADSTSELLPWAQRVSVAACRQSVALAPVTDPEQFRPMVARLEQAMAPSIAIYRDAIDHGPAQIKILAAYGLGMTNVNIIVRARSAVRVAADGGFGGAAYGGSYLDRSQRMHRALEALLTRERDAALAAFHEVARLAAADPAAARANQVTRFAVENAQTQAALLR